ncbi:MAG: NnrS family protein [Verrucomicrobiaceae bacterium]|nr:MAG: NnrS family protein [Verrucomicrobiaceae bacterium]
MAGSFHARAMRKPPPAPLVWLGSEPYRLFFLSGILFSIAGVLLWPLFFNGMLSWHPGVSHARVMIESFGGAFVIGFLGTAGPRILEAPRLKPWELIPLFLLHLAGGACHLTNHTAWGDGLFLALLTGFSLSLFVRLLFFREDTPPPPLLLAGVGILCGLVGTLLWCNPGWMTTPEIYRLAGLLLYQGFLLAPVMGVGIFLFPRLLGDSFGGPGPGKATRRSWWAMATAAVCLVSSFAIEVWWNPTVGILLRAAAFAFALSHVRWMGKPGSPKVGTLANALRVFCIPLAFAGVLAPAFLYARHIPLDHLLFVGGFGLVCLIAGSRVLFGHSGDVARFAKRSWIARTIVFFAVLAALTRTSSDFLPRVIISHYQYAAAAWALAAILWMLWHARRFFKRDAED